MRFNFAKILVAVSVASVAARPTLDNGVAARDVIPAHEFQERAVINSVTPLVGEVLKALGVPQILGNVGKLLNGQLGKTLDQLGLTFALIKLGLPLDRKPSGDVQAIGRAITQLLKGLGIDEVNANLNKATNGVLNDLSKALGVDNVLEALGITGILGATPGPN